jgi:ABC-2 type transport system ATP-binding protein
VRASIGAVTGGERSVYYKLSGRENLIHSGRLYRLPRMQAKERTDELLGRIVFRASDGFVRYRAGIGKL